MQCFYMKRLFGCTALFHHLQVGGGDGVIAALYALAASLQHQRQRAARPHLQQDIGDLVAAAQGIFLSVYEDGAELYLSDEDESFKILAVEGYNARSCMPGLHVITEEGVVFYFGTLGEETTDGGEQ